MGPKERGVKEGTWSEAMESTDTKGPYKVHNVPYRVGQTTLGSCHLSTTKGTFPFSGVLLG
jgi:hypothetical protein